MSDDYVAHATSCWRCSLFGPCAVAAALLEQSIALARTATRPMRPELMEALAEATREDL